MADEEKQKRKAIASEIRQLLGLLEDIPVNWDGKASILEMKEKQSRHWRQMEWIGFYGEMKVVELIRDADIFRIPGRKYGNVKFDFSSRSGINWDIKVHPWDQPAAILNDREAIDASIAEFGYHGLLMIMVACKYEDPQTREFKTWHDRLKGKKSRYVQEGEKISRRSRRRKTEAQLIKVRALMLDARRTAQLSLKQEGWVNADGRPRRAKYEIANVQISEFAEFPPP